MNCPKCNHQVDDNTKFCPECGEKLSAPVEDTAPVSEAVENNTPDTPNVEEPTPPTSNDGEKKKKKSKVKKIILISVLALVACAIIYVILYIWNPGCIIHHGMGHSENSVTCTEDGEEKYICDDCNEVIWSSYHSALGHDFYYGQRACNRCGEARTCDEYSGVDHEFPEGDCGTTQKCNYCDETKTFTHELKSKENDDGSSTYEQVCERCGKIPLSSLIVPDLPTTVNEKNSYGNITDIYTIKSITPSCTEYTTAVSLQVTRSYPTNTSGNATIAWKLYDPAGMVVASGQDRTSVSIGFLETAYIRIELPTNIIWEDGYKLVFLNLIDR